MISQIACYSISLNPSETSLMLNGYALSVIQLGRLRGVFFVGSLSKSLIQGPRSVKYEM